MRRVEERQGELLIENIHGQIDRLRYFDKWRNPVAKCTEYCEIHKLSNVDGRFESVIPRVAWIRSLERQDEPGQRRRRRPSRSIGPFEFVFKNGFVLRAAFDGSGVFPAFVGADRFKVSMSDVAEVVFEAPQRDGAKLVSLTYSDGTKKRCYLRISCVDLVTPAGGSFFLLRGEAREFVGSLASIRRVRG